CDANVSVMKKGAEKFGERTEIKNLNSFRNVEKAIEFEILRQIGVLESCGEVLQETRLWYGARKETRSMRSKEEAHDYRYFPEPDLVPVIVTQEELDRIAAELPELAIDRKRRLSEQYDLPLYDAGVLTESHELGDYFEAT